MRFESEKELEDVLCEYYKVTGKCKISGDTHDFYIRQFDIPGYGIADIVGIDYEYEEDGKVNLYFFIIELKNGSISSSHIEQICRYKTGFERYKNKIINVGNIKRVEVYGQIVGTDIGNACYLSECLEWLDVYTFNIDISGTFFNIREGWHSSCESKNDPFHKSLKDVRSHIEGFLSGFVEAE